jgi:hypothetical protein
MPFLNRYLGNPVLTGLLNSLFGLDTSDAHSGMRAFTRDAFERMGLRCEGMEFASEIVIAAARADLRVTEVPITYHPRLGHSKLRRWRDGARHVRFMLTEALRPRTPTTTTPQTGMASEQPDDFSPRSPGDSSRTNGSLRPTTRVTPGGAVATGPSDTNAEYDPDGSHPEPSSETTEP